MDALKDMRRDAKKLRDFVMGIAVLCVMATIIWLVIGGMAAMMRADEAHGLANPQTKGKNVRVFATTTFTKVPATGQNCSVNLINLQTEPLYSCYGSSPGDGGIGCTKNVGIPVCNPAAGLCIGNWLVRDTVPDAIYYGLGTTPADGGIHIKIEMGSGCVSN